MGLAAGVADVVATFASVTFRGAPLRVVDDSAQISAPCVWLPVPSIAFQYGKRVLEVDWQAYLVAPNQSTQSVSSTLSELVDAVAGLLPFTDGTPQPLTPQGGGQPWPSYQLVWSSRIPIGV